MLESSSGRWPPRHRPWNMVGSQTGHSLGALPRVVAMAAYLSSSEGLESQQEKRLGSLDRGCEVVERPLTLSDWEADDIMSPDWEH